MGLEYLPIHENHKNQLNVGKYTIHGSYGRWLNGEMKILFDNFTISPFFSPFHHDKCMEMVSKPALRKT